MPKYDTLNYVSILDEIYLAIREESSRLGVIVTNC